MTTRTDLVGMTRFAQIAALLLGMLSIPGFARQLKDTTAAVIPDSLSAMDSVRVQSTAAAFGRESKDTTTAVGSARDSMRIRFIDGMGSLQERVDSLDMLHQSQFIWTDARYAGELFWRIPGFHLRELGEAGKPSLLSAFGLDMRHIAVLLDGRPMNDPVSGQFNVANFPLEFVDHFEVFSGPMSIGTGSSAAAVALNISTKWFNSPRPLTKVRFVQDAKETILTDGLFTQNILRGLNLMLAFQRNSSQGRFVNARLDAWSVRTRIRYNVSDRFNLAMTDLYTKATNGMNGGVDMTRSLDPFDDGGGATVVDRDSYEILTRRDITLGGIGRFLPDSSSTTHLSGYYSAIEREYTTPSGSPIPIVSDIYDVRFGGVRVEQRLNSDAFALTLGAMIERRATNPTDVLRSVSENLTALNFKMDVRVLTAVRSALAVRHELFRGTAATSAGIQLSLFPASGMEVFGSGSSSTRFPTLQELYWTDSTLIRRSPLSNERQTGLQAGLRWNQADAVRLSVTAFQQSVHDAILWRPDTTMSGTPAVRVDNIAELRTQGVAASAQVTVHPFEFLGTLTYGQYRENDTLKSLVPQLVGGVELAYHNQFFDDALDARFGLRTRFSDRSIASTFLPAFQVSVEDPRYQLGRFTVLDLFTVVRIGDVHLSVTWNNVVNINYLMVGYYPMPKRSVRLGVHWVFFD